MSGVDDAIPGIWNRIERILRAEAPEVAQTLALGALKSDIDELESALPVRLPRDLRRSLKLHNGQRDPSQCLKLCGVMSLMPTDDIRRNWRMLTEIAVDCERQEGVHSPHRNSLNNDWWRRSCIPFAHCEGYYTCVDMDASLGSKMGRVVEHTHDSAMEDTKVPSFADWLERVATALEAGSFVRDDYGFFRVHPRFP